MLSEVGTVILDELHALAGGKRGAHLALTLERLEMLTQKPLRRIGMSATQRAPGSHGALSAGRQAGELRHH